MPRASEEYFSITYVFLRPSKHYSRFVTSDASYSKTLDTYGNLQELSKM